MDIWFVVWIGVAGIVLAALAMIFSERVRERVTSLVGDHSRLPAAVQMLILAVMLVYVVGNSIKNLFRR